MRYALTNLLLALLLTLLGSCSAAGRAGFVGRWLDSTGAVTEFRSDGVAVGSDGAESKWSVAPVDEASGLLTLVLGDIVMEFDYLLDGDTLTLTPVSLAGETELAPAVGQPTVLTRVTE